MRSSRARTRRPWYSIHRSRGYAPRGEGGELFASIVEDQINGTEDVPEGGYCGRLIWPWQDVVREYRPMDLVHHACHHRSTEYLWRQDYGDRWTEWLNCEHTTDRLVKQEASG